MSTVTEQIVRGVGPQVGAMLRMVWEHVQERVYARLTAEGFDDLRAMHRPFQQFPPMDGLRPTDVAERHRMSKQATNDLLRDLERLGYITLEPDPVDGRARRIRYTQRAWRHFELGSATSRSVGQRWADVVGQERFDQFVETLREILAYENEGRPDVAT
jgi:DNA-binding MarR family transcriptional regulator